MNVNLHIERLVIEGLGVGSHEALLLRSAVEAELARLLSAPGAAQQFDRDRAVQRVLSEGTARPSGGMAALGEHIGNAVFEAVAR